MFIHGNLTPLAVKMTLEGTIRLGNLNMSEQISLANDLGDE